MIYIQQCSKHEFMYIYVHKHIVYVLGSSFLLQSKGESEELGESGEYNVYSTFQSHEPDFDYLKSLEIEEKINKIRWLPQQNAAHFLLSTNGNHPTSCPSGVNLASYLSI